MNFFLWHGALRAVDHDGVAPDAGEPVDDFVGIANAATEHQNLRAGGSECNGELVVGAAGFVGQHLVFINDQKAGTFTAEEFAFLRFQSGDDDGSIEAFGRISGRDADIPTAAAPFVEFVISEGASGNGVNCLAFEAGLNHEFKNESLTGSCGGVDYDVFAVLEMSRGFLLPDVWDFYVVIKTVH